MKQITEAKAVELYMNDVQEVWHVINDGDCESPLPEKEEFKGETDYDIIESIKGYHSYWIECYHNTRHCVESQNYIGQVDVWTNKLEVKDGGDWDDEDENEEVFTCTECNKVLEDLEINYL